MKYTININQLAMLNINSNFDLTDMAIFDFVKDFCNNPNSIKKIDNGVIFTMISHKVVIAALPAIKITTRQNIHARLKKLIDNDLLVAHKDNGKNGETAFFAFGKNYAKALFIEDTCNANITGGVTQTLQGCNANITGGVTQTLHNKVDNNKNKEITYKGISNYAEKKFLEKNEPLENKEPLEENFSFEKNEKRKKVSQKKEKAVLFSESAVSDFEVFKSAFIGTKYEIYDLEYYYEAVSNWSSSSNAKKIDWIATARGFILRDIGNNKAKLPNTQKEQTLPVKTAKKQRFEDSEWFENIESFKNEILKDEQYACFDSNFYYQKIKLWASTSQAQLTDWIATAKKFMLSDLQENKAKLVNNLQNTNQNVKSSNNNPSPFDRLERAASKVREAFANAGDIQF